MRWKRSLAGPPGLKLAEYFWSSPLGKERLDGLCMLFAAIGESLKKLDRITGGSLLSRYPGIDWKGAMGFRDFIAHHYFDIDAEMVFLVCKQKVPALLSTMRPMAEDLR
jgi:uncharacterized protein with HEPN domain